MFTTNITQTNRRTPFETMGNYEDCFRSLPPMKEKSGFCQNALFIDIVSFKNDKSSSKSRSLIDIS